MMQWIAVILGFLLLLGAEGPRRHHNTRCESARVAGECERRWRAVCRLMKDTWIRFQGIAAGEEAVL